MLNFEDRRKSKPTPAASRRSKAGFVFRVGSCHVLSHYRTMVWSIIFRFS